MDPATQAALEALIGKVEALSTALDAANNRVAMLEQRLTTHEQQPHAPAQQGGQQQGGQHGNPQPGPGQPQGGSIMDRIRRIGT